MNVLEGMDEAKIGLGQRFGVPVTASLVYLTFAHFLIGTRPEQFFLAFLFSALYLLSTTTRRWVLGFSIFIIFWVLFDFMKAFPNYLYNTVHIADLYQLERSIFGIAQDGVEVTPNEFAGAHASSVLDLLAGLFYLCWVPVPLAFAMYLFAKSKSDFLKFSLTFLLVNLIGFVIYYIYPAAPPWYVDQYGFDLIPNTPGNTAGLGRFDALTGTAIFSSLYAKSSNVFAAMPSLHAAYPMVVLYFGLKRRMGSVNVLFALIMLGIWFAAVYSGHHYVLDVLLGIGCAVLGILLFSWLLRWPVARRWFERYEGLISG